MTSTIHATKIQKVIRSFIVRKRILIPGSEIQTKNWRKNQKWYRGGKHNECELYQRSLIEKITQKKCNKSDKRINIITKKIIDKKYPMKEVDGFEWTEDFDGHIELEKKELFFNLKIICDAGGAQTRSLREVYHFITCQLDHLVENNEAFGINKYFINILDGNTCYNSASKFEYLFNKPQYQYVKQYIFVGDMQKFQDKWHTNLSL